MSHAARACWWMLAFALAAPACAQVGLQHRNINGELLDAARSGNSAAVQALLGQGASPDSRNRLGAPPLNTAARAGDLPMAQLLIGAGADINLQNLAGVTPLMSAAYNGHTEIVQLLLRRRAALNPVDRVKKTAAIYAA